MVYQVGHGPDTVSATITVSAEDTNVRQILVTLKDANGVAIDYIETVTLIVFLNAAKTAFVVTGGTTGIELGAGGQGAILALVAKKVFLATTEVNGQLDLKWTDTGTEAAFLGVALPNGEIVMSSALTNA